MSAHLPANTDEIIKALIHRYVKVEDDATTDNAGAVNILRGLSTNTLSGATTLTSAIASAFPDTVFPPLPRAIIASIDDCVKVIFALADLEPEVEAQLRIAIPTIALQVIADPALPTETHASVFTILDKLVEGMIGWSSSLGRTGEKTFKEATDIIARLCQDEPDIAGLDAELGDFIAREQSRVAKLEQRLTASEIGILRASQARSTAAEMINKAMQGHPLTASIVAFLQGPWYDSIQLLLLNEGFHSDAWHRACKITDTIVWTYQPIAGDDAESEKERQRLYRIIENLPAEIRELLVALEHNTNAAEQALEDIESEHVMIVSGQAQEFVEFDPIACEAPTAGSKVSRLLLRKVNAVSVGQWFSFEQDGDSTRIKLILKDDEVKQLLFTNRNGMKALQRSFDEAAYDMTSGVIKPLNHEAVFSSTFATFYNGLVEEHVRQMKRLAERRADFDQEQEARDAALRQAADEAAAQARADAEAELERREARRRDRLQKAQEIADLPENAETLALLKDKVNELGIGAWLKLPDQAGKLEDAKLAVRISASDKLIFVGPTGTRLGEYSSEQLVHLLVAGDAQIQDEGVEFEDTLAAVVNRLRDDRTKSYDDLTGTN